MSSKCEQVARWRPGGDFQLMLHKERAGTALEDINYPLLETPQEWIIHGFSHANYLAELGHKAQSKIYKKSSLDQAMKDAFRKARRFLMTAKDFSEDETISLLLRASATGDIRALTGARSREQRRQLLSRPRQIAQI
jgi:acetamidase/formamidase